MYFLLGYAKISFYIKRKVYWATGERNERIWRFKNRKWGNYLKPTMCNNSSIYVHT